MSGRSVIVFWDYSDLQVLGGNWCAWVKKCTGICGGEGCVCVCGGGGGERGMWGEGGEDR